MPFKNIFSAWTFPPTHSNASFTYLLLLHCPFQNLIFCTYFLIFFYLSCKLRLYTSLLFWNRSIFSSFFDTIFEICNSFFELYPFFICATHLSLFQMYLRFFYFFFGSPYSLYLADSFAHTTIIAEVVPKELSSLFIQLCLLHGKETGFCRE